MKTFMQSLFEDANHYTVTLESARLDLGDVIAGYRELFGAAEEPIDEAIYKDRINRVLWDLLVGEPYPG